MSERTIRRLLPLLALIAGGILAISMANVHADAKHLARDVRNAGYSNVKEEGVLTVKATAVVHSCTIGFDHDGTSGGPRTINGHEVYPFNVSIVSSSDTWTRIPLDDNTTPTPDELSAYLGQHWENYPCYRP